MTARCARTPDELAYLTGNTARLSFFTCACARVAGWMLLPCYSCTAMRGALQRAA